MGKDPRYLKSNIPKTIRKAFVVATEDPELLSLSKELALQRALLDRALKVLEKQINSSNPKEFVAAAGVVSSLVKEIRDTDATMAAIEGKLSLHVDIKVFPMIINQMVAVIKGEIGDERILQRISQRLGSVRIDGGSGRFSTVKELEAR